MEFQLESYIPLNFIISEKAPDQKNHIIVQYSEHIEKFARCGIFDVKYTASIFSTHNY